MTKYIFLAALAALAGLSIGSKAPADMPFMPLGGGGGATSGYPVKIDVRAELETTRRRAGDVSARSPSTRPAPISA